MLENWKEKLSILTCKYFFDGYEGKRIFESDGFSEEVYLFDADYTVGLTTEWKHIFMNQRLFEENLEKAQRQTFLHEKGHANSSILHLITGSIPLLFFYAVAPLAGFLSISVLITDLVFNAGIVGLTSSDAWRYLYILALSFPVAVTISYIIETKADLFSLKYMEPEEFREAKESFKEVQPITKFRMFLIRLTHPSPSFVLNIYRLLNREEYP